MPAPAPRWSRATVAQPIESRVVGVDNMIYMKSTSGNDGSYYADRHVRGRHRPRPQHRQGAEPRQPRRGAAAAGGARPGRQRQEEIVGAAAGRRDDLARRPLRPALSEQLRDDQHHRRLKRVPGVGDVVAVHAGRLQHADLARQRPHDEPRPDAERHRQRGQAAEHAGRGRPHRRAAGAARISSSSSPSRPRAAHQRRGIRQRSWCAPIRTARSCACATWRASSSARGPPSRSAARTAVPPR